jgi:predicted amidohydrolase YtcJ
MTTSRLRVLIIGLTSIALAGCNKPEVTVEATGIYSNGQIVTVDDAVGTVEALAVKDGRILALGSDRAMEQYRGENTKLINLQGNTMLPGFVDAHSHLSGVAIQAVSANLLPAPDGPVNNIAQLQQTLRTYIAESPVVAEHRVVIGFNYDDSQLEERRHPNRHDLDAVSTELPIMALHQSGHLGVYNSKALEILGINAESINPLGGVIEREADGKTPNGILQENAHFAVVYSMVPDFTPAQYMAALKAGEMVYASNGFTTIQDGKTDPLSLKTFATVSAAGALNIDLVAYPDLVKIKDDSPVYSPLLSRDYSNHFRIGGVKLTFDGSPQGKTAWFSHPYHQPPLNQSKSYAGYGAFSNKEALKWFELAYKNNWQLMVHANGDAAIEQFINTARVAQQNNPASDRRTVLIHGQYLRADQVSSLDDLDIFPALYPMHTFYWGDWHRRSVAGPKRAENISPTGWLLERGMKFSIHSDAPVTFPDSMRVLHTAVNRATRSGYVIGPEHKLSPMEGIKAMTIWPAYQHFEEGSKGSLEVGKLADFVILNKNPLTEDPSQIENILVLETIKQGESVYSAPSPANSSSKKDPIAELVSRLELDSYKSTLKGLTQFGDRRQGTTRNSNAIDWIEKQLADYGCEDIQRITYTYDPKPRPPRTRKPLVTDPAKLITATGGAVGRNGSGPGGSSIYGYRVETGVNRDLNAQPDARIRELNREGPTNGERQEVYCTKIGTSHPDEMYIVSAHMDGHGVNEAVNDDGSGTALVMELARILSSPDVQTERSIRFALWNNEETGLNGSKAYIEQRLGLQGIENPPGSGLYPEPRWLGVIQHDMMLWDHGAPRADGTVSSEQRLEADVNIEFQSNSELAEQSMKLAFIFKAAADAYNTDYPATVGPHMTNTDSTPFMNMVPSISLRENERGAQTGAGWNPTWHTPLDVWTTFSDKDFRLGLNAAQTTLAAIAELSGTTIQD